MISHVSSAVPFGFDGRIIEVEGGSNHGLPSFTIVGMANKTITEATERVRSAIKYSRLTFPPDRIVINLAPAEFAKTGSFLDLPIALAILSLSGQIPQSSLNSRLFVGELSLDGHLRPVRGIINIVETAKSAGFSEIFLPYENARQASLVQGINIYPVRTLLDLILHLCHQRQLSALPARTVVKNTRTGVDTVLLEDIHGQKLAKRALMLAVAGHHNLLLSGPPGTGKTLLSRVGNNLLPDPSPPEQISITKIHSLNNPSTSIITGRPFRAPHHTSSLPALIGGGASLKPGEISLAHLGILFLDELPEYPKKHLEALRQPLEDRHITLCHANEKCTYPADFTLIATMNPCPCGYYGDPTHECICTAYQVQQYQKKLSGPLLDRIDLRVNVSRVKNSELSTHNITDPRLKTSVVKNTITEVLKLQEVRYHSNTKFNGTLTAHETQHLIPLSSAVRSLLDSASDKLNLSTRSYFKLIRISRTIADFEGSAEITPAHLSEALTYR